MKVFSKLPLTGRMGDFTLYQVNGETHAKKHPKNIKNPRTVSQMKQRIKMGNILDMYKYIKSFLQDNFEGRRGNQNAATFFRSHNMMQTPVWITQQQKNTWSCVLAPYVVSQGRFPAVSYEFQNGYFVTDINLGTQEAHELIPIKDFSASIIANNEGWTIGDNLKIMLVRQKKSAEGEELPSTQYSAIKITLSESTDGMGTISMLDTNNSLGRLALCNIGGKLAVQVIGTDEFIYAFAAVHSKGAGTNIFASPQKLCLSDNTLYDYYCSDDALNLALDSYKTNRV